MKKLLCLTVLMSFAASGPSIATGFATCESGPEENWQSQAELEKRLVEIGWQVRRIKVDGGCYEVYALDEDGKRVEAYFHPDTLDRVPMGE
jgi:hypothetical protein